MLHDRTAGTGFDRHYIYHTAWAARKIRRIGPSVHVDIGSSLFFAGMISAFVPLKFYDFRPADLRLDNLTTAAADLTSLHFPDGSVDSLSCMHVVEHVGLGRYGDPLDPDGDRKAMSQLARVIAPGGSLLFVVPIGRPLIRFNAHRIYAYRQVIDSFSSLSLVEFSLIPDGGVPEGLIVDATEAQADAQRYGCGCFWFRKNSFVSEPLP
ncbi:MAG TPA: DUF268 domain-containing protein [Tepidisphaeraceae bacterium]|nr:DUF268 domain-containing protein [Tepidisphaeraceae bacterium]